MREGNLTKKDLGFISVVEQGLSKLPDVTGEVYRNVDFGVADIALYKVGAVITEPSFLSSSKKKYLKGFQNKTTHIVIKSKSGKFIQNLSKYPQQYEVLFQEKRQFKVIENRYEPSIRQQYILLEDVDE